MARPRVRLGPLAVSLVGVAWVVLSSPGPGDDRQDRYQRGAEIFQSSCAACHGTRAQGGSGAGLTGGPPLDGLDIALVDLTVRTGRMPIADPSAGVYADRLDDDERDALVLYLAERFELPGMIPTVEPGDASRGQELYARNCAACHGAGGDGGIAGAQVQVPSLFGADDVAIVAASRTGPFEMPAFDASVLSDEDLADIVGYLRAVSEAPRSPVGLREVDQITGGLLALGLGLVASLVLFIVARVRRLHPEEPSGYHRSPPFEPRT